MRRWSFGSFGFVLSWVLLLAACSQPYNDLEPQAGKWQLLGRSLATGNRVTALNHDLAANPWFAFYAPGSAPYISVTKWDNATNTGQGIPGISTPSTFFSINDIEIDFDTLNRPVIAWSQAKPFVGESGTTIFIKRYNETTGLWGTLATFSTQWTQNIELAMVGSRPVIAFDDAPWSATTRPVFVQQLTSRGPTWATYPNATANSSFFELALDSQKRPVLAFVQSGQASVKVEKWNGSSWAALGTFPSQGPSQDVRLETNASGNPVVLNMTTSGVDVVNLNVVTWTGQNWVGFGNAVSSTARVYSGDMTLDTEGNPYVTWTDGGNLSAYVKHWNVLENRWRFVGGNPVSNIQGNTLGGGPLIDARESSLVVTWRRTDGLFAKRYVP